MSRTLQSSAYAIAVIGCALLAGIAGCKSGCKLGACTTKACAADQELIAGLNRIEYADLNQSVDDQLLDVAPPLTSATELPDEAWAMTLDEAIAVAFENTEVLRGLGAQVLRSPESVPAAFDPAIASTDPTFGVEAALAAFDAQFTGGVTYANNDQVFNNRFDGGGSNEVQQDLTTARFGLQKTSATGTRFALRGNVQNDINNRFSNLFDNSWTTLLEAEVRQPLLQGRGLAFNRIAGPGAQPGFRTTSGVLISRVNNDISIAQFERNVRQFVDEVVNSYWQLYFAYRNFEVMQSARVTAQKTWNAAKARFDNDLPGGEADKEAYAREQYFVFEGRLIEALNGNTQGGIPGVLQSESELRRLLNLPQSDGRLIRPADQPAVADVAFDWYELADRALARRVELREQEWRVKRRELELLAARNFTLPQLDAVATFRNNGFGDDLFWGGSGRFSSALDVARAGDYQEWEVGLQMNVPIGFRRASAGVRNAELRVQREKRVLEEQQQQILHDLGSAVRRTDETFALVHVAQSRMDAARDSVDAREAAFEAEATPFDQLLDAQRRLVESEVGYYRETINWAIAVESVSRESGQLLTSHMIYFNEGPSCNVAGVNMKKRVRKINRANKLDYRVASPGYVGQSVPD